MKTPGFYRMYRQFKKGRVSGQITVLITLFVAVAFLFLAVVLNLSKVSQNKLMVTIAAQSGAINLASMASSSANYFKYSPQGLKGQDEYCKSNGKLAKIFGTIIGIVLIVLGAPQGAALVLAAVSAALAVVSLVLYIAVVEPGLVEAWNKEMKKLSREQQFVEVGIRAALLNSINDSEKMPERDSNDYDMDGETNDYTSRFGEWYRNRLVSLSPSGFADNIRDFLCTDPDGLADISAYIRYYNPSSGDRNCTYDHTYSPNFLEFLGKDDDIAPGQAPNPADAEGLFDLFYDIKSAGTDLNNQPYEFTFWKPGVVSCSAEDDIPCVLGSYVENDNLDFLKLGVSNFFRWAYGQSVREESESGLVKIRWYPGVVNTPIADLASDVNNWFGELYNPDDPANGWYSDIEQWKAWLTDWVGSSTALGSLQNIASRMTAEYYRIWILMRQVGTAQHDIDQLTQKINQILVWQDLGGDGQPILPAPNLPDLHPGPAPALVDMWSSYEWWKFYWLACRTCINIPGTNPCDAYVPQWTQWHTMSSNALINIYYPHALPLQMQLAEMLGLDYQANHNHDAHLYILGNYIPDARQRISELTDTKAAAMQELRALHLCCKGGYCCSGTPCHSGEICCSSGFRCSNDTCCDDSQLLASAQARMNLLAALILRVNDPHANGAAISKFNELKDKLSEFQSLVTTLNGHVQTISLSNATPPYSWQDEKLYWHHVKVEVATPCEYPTIQSREDGSENCYFLSPNAGKGWVGVRVTRFDEDQKQPIKFTTGQGLWKFIFYHPAQGPSTDPANAELSLAHGISSTACARFGPDGEDLRFAACPAGISFAGCHSGE